MMEWTRYAPSQLGPAIAYKIRISSAQVERKSSRAARGHRAKVLPKCETIISIPCAVGERRVAVFPLFRAVIPLLSAAVFQAKSRSYQGVSGKSERKCGLSAARLLLRAPAFRPKSRGCPRGCRRGLLQIGCTCSKKGRHRPVGDRARRSFTLATNPLQMQPDGARDRSVARRKYPEQRDALRQGEAGRG